MTVPDQRGGSFARHEESDGLLAVGASTASALTMGYRLAFGIGAGLVAARVVLAATLLRPEGAPAGEEERAGDPMDKAMPRVCTTARSDIRSRNA
jgi:hypothetical protein